MSKENLIVIAGCNGSGKSTFGNLLISEDMVIFDADKRKKEIYDGFSFDFELRDEMSWNQTQQEFEKFVFEALELKTNFAFETNFHHKPMTWVNKFKSSGFKVHLLFFALENTNVAIERVAIRFQGGGHFVRKEEIEKRYFKGFENLDNYFQEFDSILILETSAKNKKPQTIAFIDFDKTVTSIHPTPAYFKNVCPLLTRYIEVI